MKKAAIVILLLLSGSVHGQNLEEIVVTGSRQSVDNIPVVLTVKGDFFLQEVLLVNDSLSAGDRFKDVKQTFENLIVAANNNADIELATGEERLIPIKNANRFDELFSDSLDKKGRVYVILKASINDRDSEEGALEDKILNFVKKVNLSGRTLIQKVDEPQISVINPRQYRTALIKSISEDIKNITSALGSDYRVTVSGLDNQMDWYRDGDDTVAFYIPYRFQVIPKNITTMLNADDF